MTDTRFDSSVGQLVGGNPLPPTDADLKTWTASRWWWERFWAEDRLQELDRIARLPAEPVERQPDKPTLHH